MVDDTPFSPDWVSPPGATIATILEARRDAQRAGEVDRTVDGRRPGPTRRPRGDYCRRSPAARQRAWHVGGVLARQNRNTRGSRAAAAGGGLPESVGWLNEIPVKDIERWGWLGALANPAAAAAACLQFFGVPSVGAWREVYGDALAAAYRTSPTYTSEPGAVATWVRQGEIAASSIECGLWDPGGSSASSLPCEN